MIPFIRCLEKGKIIRTENVLLVDEGEGEGLVTKGIKEWLGLQIFYILTVEVLTGP